MRKSARAPKLNPAVFDPDLLPTIYGLAVAGDCMAPAYPDKTLVRISKAEPYRRGDVVAVWLRPEIVTPGQSNAMLKRVRMMPPPWVTFPYLDSPRSEALAVVMLGMDSRPNEMIPIRCAHVLAMHKVVGPLAVEDTHPADLAALGRPA